MHALIFLITLHTLLRGIWKILNRSETELNDGANSEVAHCLCTLYSVFFWGGGGGGGGLSLQIYYLQ